MRRLVVGFAMELPIKHSQVILDNKLTLEPVPTISGPKNPLSARLIQVRQQCLLQQLGNNRVAQ